jgi:arsenate reductase (thioredoxin)
MEPKPVILILCTGNSCRSHMAEGFLRTALGGIANVQSAGSNPAGYVHPLAIKVMAEAGIDISTHRSKHMDEFLNQPVNTLITVCGNADQACPVFPGQLNRHHWPFFDPAKAIGGEQEILKSFRDVRDEMRCVFEAYADGLRDSLKSLTAPGSRS